VADLARDAARPAEGAAVDHEARADARREAQIGHHVGAAADAEGRFAQRSDIRVVVQVDGEPEALLHLRGGVEGDPAGQDRLRVHAAALAVDRAGQPHARSRTRPRPRRPPDELRHERRRVQRILGGGVDSWLREGLARMA
jgi:hypothetical protein